MHPQMNHEYMGHNLVFIVGAPRSGTTWLQRLLATHPRIRTGQESKLFRWYIGPQLQMWRMETTRELDPKTATGRGGTGLSCYFREDEFLSALKQYLGLLLQPMIGSLRPGELFVEKSPSHAMCIPEIKRLLPEARIIHVLRDPRDVVASLLAASRTWGAAWAPESPVKAAGLWVEHVRAVKRAAQNLSPEEFHEVTYEQLRSAPEKVVRQVADFLGLEWKDFEIQKAVETNQPDRDGGTPIPVYGEVSERIGGFVKEPAGFIRKARPGAWKSDLSLLEKAHVWRVCHKLMREVGYR
jgi:LPS sulfotransferase NodH